MKEQKENYRYFAFISYKREDESWAKWLQHRIETYRLPSVIRKSNSDLPRRIRPVFRDKTDLSGGVLGVTLDTELQESKYLIVICSPNSAKSEWVSKEIERFRELGRWDKIIPLIIAGEPHAQDPADECFPAELRIKNEHELLGISVIQDGKTKAMLKVIAKMLDLKFDDLYNRHRQRLVRSASIWSAIAVLLLTLFTFFSYSHWDYNREKVSYFADYVDEWGIPKGIFPLKEEQLAKRSGHYRFISQRGLLRKVIHANSAGEPVREMDDELADRPMIQRFSYNESKLTYTEYLDKNDKVELKLVYSGKDYSIIDLEGVTQNEESIQAALIADTTSFGGGLLGLGRDNAFENKSAIQRWKVYSSYLKIRLDVWVENFYTSLVVFVDPLFIFLCPRTN
jgi:hypothetical protein